MMRSPRPWATLLLLAQACTTPPDHKDLTLAEQSLVIAEVFETPAPYSVRTLDSAEIAAFFDLHPEYRVDSAEIMAFYTRREMQFAWIVSDSLSASADAFIALVNTADTTLPKATELNHRLMDLYYQGFAEGRRIALCDSCATELELRLTAQFFRFADKKYGGYLKRDLRELDWFIPRRRKDPSRLLDSLAKGVIDLSAYEPVHAQYRLLKERLQRYHALAEAPWPELSLPQALRKLEPGDSAVVVAAIRERLALIGDLDSAGAGTRYDSTLVPAVQRFQIRHGLHPDGVIGAGFMKAINVPMAERLRTILINMERLRWVDEHQPADLILVNIPEFRLHVYEADTLVKSMDVVVGKTATRTVIFSDVMDRLVFSPTWTVPPGIMRADILPNLKKNPGYLASRNMELLSGGQVVSAQGIDWSRFSTGIPYTVRQKPGPSNALGLVKFLFPNEYHIYLHDTPSKGHFAKEQRAFSFGCIRVSDPVWLSEYLLKDDPDWDPARIRQAMNSGRERLVMLKHKRPVTIGYFTAWVDREDRLNFREDVYRHDERLYRELFAVGMPLQAAR